jgi:hypothetical protein
MIVGIAGTLVPGARMFIARCKEKSGWAIPRTITSPMMIADTRRGKSHATR